MTRTVPTASQTIGPFWHALAAPALADLTHREASDDRSARPPGEPPGDTIVLAGRVLDGAGAAVDDACVEIWQATPAASRGFRGWGRCATDADGGFRFVTIAPDPTAPHLAVAVFARGLVKPVWTRVYLTDAAVFAARADAVLAAVPIARRPTLLAHAAPGGWRWDIRLQGDAETVCFAL